jgi:hypothetical protein
MAGWTDGGVDIFLGVTGSGKTTLARVRQGEDCARLGLLPVTLDLESAADWAAYPHAQSVDEVLHCLYVLKAAPRIWTPRDIGERTKFFKLASHWGRVAIVVDGLPMICNGDYFEPEFRNALYRWRHGKLGPGVWYLTAMRASLTHRDTFSACRRVLVFKQAPGADAGRMWKEFKIPEGNPKIPGSGSTAFVRGQHETIELGFPEENKSSFDSSRRRIPNPTPPPNQAG